MGVISRASTTRVYGEARAPLILPLLTTLAIAIAYLISPLALTYLGVSYDDAGGSPLEKIHPATYVLAAALLVRIGLHRHPIRFLIGAAARHRGATILLWAVATLIAYVVVNLHLPFSSLVDTFLFPIMAFVLLDGIDEANARRLARLIHAIYAANAALGLVEMATGWQLMPLIAMGVDLSADHRSTALFGHPLGNAMLTGLYLIALAVGGGRDLPKWIRPAALMLQMAAMIAFGGRLALIASSFLLIIIALHELGGILAGRRFQASTAAVFLGLLPLMLVAVGAAYAGGFFDQVLERFVSDNRSAETRLIMFEMFPHFPWFQLLFGPDQELLRSLMWTEGTEFGIESFWISFFLTYGAIASVLFFLALGAFLLDLLYHSGQGAIWTIVYFLIVASGSLSIGGKTAALGLLVVADMILLRAPVRDRLEFAWPRTAGPNSPAPAEPG